MERFETHSHSMYSNIRLLDAINHPKDIIATAIKKGLGGICLTDHEALCGHIDFLQEYKKLKKDNKLPENFKIGLGNEIYLVPDLNPNHITRYFHFILIAKNEMGHQALKELSSLAWYNSFVSRGMERVPTSYANLEYIVNKYPNSLIATSACIGGELGYWVLQLVELEKKRNRDEELIYDTKMKIVEFINFCKRLFGEDFYIEVAPSESSDQYAFNERVRDVAASLGVKIVIGTDAHYLTKDERFIHKAYLTSKNGEREVDAFYSGTYIMSEDELGDYLGFTPDRIEEYSRNSLEIRDKIMIYDLAREQDIPEEEVKYYDKVTLEYSFQEYPNIRKYLESDSVQDRYWINTCINKLEELGRLDDRNLSRLEKEADIQWFISERLGKPLSAYHNTMQHYIDLFWECGSIVGPGRGSACGWLSNMLLGITQVDPLRWGLNEWRYLNKERAEIGDIDIDLAPSKRPLIFKKIREQKSSKYTGKTDSDKMLRSVGGLLQVCTFGTEGSRSAIQTACRGYRSEDYPEGIDVDIAQYMSSMIPQERGFLWPITDVIQGNEEKGRNPIRSFIEEVSKYPGLLDIILKIEGLVNKRSQHASGVILYNKEFFQTNALMRSPNGDFTTQYDLHTSEYLGDIKFDFLLTSVSDKIITSINLLQEDGMIEPELSMREVYNKYLHPEHIELDDPLIWTALAEGNVLDVFQFNSDVGLQAAKAIKPVNPFEMTAANALMRLMAEKGHERPLDRYVRLKNNISLWYQEMRDYGLTEDEIKVLEPYYLKDYGTPPYQESVMEILMDAHISGFTLAAANDARKIIGKKQMSRIPELKEKFFTSCAAIQGSYHNRLAEYVWETAILPQLGYSFSINHSLPYSFVGIQTIVLATKWPDLYWNCACLIDNSGWLEDLVEEEEEAIPVVDEEVEEEDEDEEEKVEATPKKKKTKTTNYGKIATAIGNIRSSGITILPPNIMKSKLIFSPDIQNGAIIYGLSGINKIGGNLVKTIFNNRPYTSIEDFLRKVKLNKPQMVNLIKSGAFDVFNLDRLQVMRQYLGSISDAKNRLTLQNAQMLFTYKLLPDTLEFHSRVFFFNKYIKKAKVGSKYFLDNIAYNFYEKYFDLDLLDISMQEGLVVAEISQVAWDKIYQSYMDQVRTYIKAHHDELLTLVNNKLMEDVWDKYAKGTISKWEMDSISFYHHEHELDVVDDSLYGFEDFFSLPEEPEIAQILSIKGNRVPIFKLHRIAGTVLDKNKNKSTVSILTKTGVVQVKIWQNQFVKYDRQLSQRMADGTKKVIEKSWFTRGNKIAVVGIRRDDMFVPKIYANSEYNELIALITDIDENGYLQFQYERADE